VDRNATQRRNDVNERPEPPYIVKVEMPGGWERIALGPDQTRLLVFDDHDLATRFANGLVAAGVEQATIGTLPQGDLSLVAVLDHHDAPAPCSFEIEVASDYPQEPVEVAYSYGLVAGRQIVEAYNLTSPN
jgi:hypothetical protein